MEEQGRQRGTDATWEEAKGEEETLMTSKLRALHASGQVRRHRLHEGS